MLHVPLVELVGPRHEHDHGGIVAATGSTSLLPHRGERSGEPVQHSCVKSTDIDPKLKRAGRDDTDESTIEEILFDLAAFGRQVPSAVRPNLPSQSPRQTALYLARHNLGSTAASAEGHGAPAALDQRGDNSGDLGIRA